MWPISWVQMIANRPTKQIVIKTTDSEALAVGNRLRKISGMKTTAAQYRRTWTENHVPSEKSAVRMRQRRCTGVGS